MDGPLKKYQQAVKSGEIIIDPGQEGAVNNLQRLFDDLIKSKPKAGILARLLGRNPADPIRGLYFWGGVGRGKTYLMDVFFECLPFEEKRRMHFHRFMRQVHRRLNALQGESNPLGLIAEEFAAEVRLLCFDEFFVSDITDAMILAGLLESLLSHRVVIVVTSNIEPEYLYKDGLQRRKFLPAIELIKDHTDVINVDGGIDHRLRALESAEIYHFPLDKAADESLSVSFGSLSPDEGRDQVQLEIEGRFINARKCGDGVVWFEFSELCEGPRSQNDYIELAMIYQTVLVGNVPRFTVKKEDAARRFISLIDEFYDRNVKLVISAEVPIEDLYAGERLGFEFRRTASRLQEMQSHEYLAREHLP